MKWDILYFFKSDYKQKCMKKDTEMDTAIVKLHEITK